MGANTCAPDTLRVERVTSRAALDRLRPEWDALWASIPDRTPFQSSAWIYPWWDAFGTGDLLVLVIRDGARLIGIAPLYSSTSEDQSELRLLGAGVSDYLDVLAAPGTASVVADALSRQLESDADWTVCAFDGLRPGSPLLELTMRRDSREIRGAEEPCPTLRLPSSIDQLADVIGTSFASSIRSSQRRAERLGGLVVEQPTADTVHVLLATLFDLHGNRWAAKGGRGVLADERVRAFHCLAAPALHAAGLLRMYGLRIGGRIAAVHYGLQAARRTFFYIGGFDPSFASLSPGTLAIAAAIERAVMEGATEIDFLSGREAYKYRWHAIDRPRFTRQFQRVAQDRERRAADAIGAYTNDPIASPA